jgi:photosystem II stability/assembly factor-like uncharacterized protein
MSGRIEAIDGLNSDPRIIYVGAAGGGVWKTINGGMTFKAVFDKYSQSIGAIAVDQSHPDTVWVGTGESDTRNSASIGTGIYKTTDGGENWQLMGLEKSERIARIAVDSTNSNVVYAAVPGHLWDASEDRGLYKTSDGGKTWEKILYINADTGCSDVVLDPQEPRIIYATTWQFRRKPYFFTSGGPGGGIYKSVDAGKTWTKLTNGLPSGDLGRIAIAVAPSRPSVLYATVEAKKTALYRSEDMGASWKQVSNDINVQVRPFYFSHLYVDPKDHKRVYKPGFNLTMSADGGETFTILGASTHSDHHAMYINPIDPTNLYLGTDGGVYESSDRGRNWRIMRNLPVSQFYHVTYDMEMPYNVYGGLQDNGSWAGPSQSVNGVENKDWLSVGFGDGFWVWSDPTDENFVYSEFQGGKILRYDRKTKDIKEVGPFAKEGTPKLRFNWNTPIEISEKNPKAMYVGAQKIFKTTNKGESWEEISPDLTTDDKEKQRQEDSGGLTIDNSSAENHCTVFTISASPLDENLIWAGTDDGNLQVTRDGGKTWTNVITHVPGLPKNTWVSTVEASRKDPAIAYATFDGHQTGDMKIYVYKTTDFGQTWKSISTDSIKGYAHVIREDPVNPNLLFVGTELGLYLSIDDGQQWAQFTGNFPPVAVRDLAIHPREQDLLIATHGRGIYIVDDITPLRKLSDEILNSKFAFIETRPAQIRFPRISQDFPGDDEYVGSNPPEAAWITYYLKDRHMMGDMRVEIYDSEGKLISTLAAGKRKGINRVPWFMRLKPPKVAPSPEIGFGAMVGPTVPEGTYKVKVIKGTETYETQIVLGPDPTVPYSAEDRKIQFETSMSLYRMQERLAYLADQMTGARDQARDRAKKMKSGEALAKELNGFADRLDALHKTIVATKEGNLTGEEQTRERALELYLFVSFHAGRPTESQMGRMEVLNRELDAANQKYDAIIGKELSGLNTKLGARKLEPIKIMTKEEWDKKQS